MDLLRVKKLFFLTIALFSFACAQADTGREYQIKAVFLFNFAQFTEWPPEVFESTNSPLVIGILGSDPFGTFLDETVRGEIIKGHRIRIERFKTLSEIKTCHILYIGHSEANRIEPILESLRSKPVLTVADFDTPASAGVIVRFISEHNRVRFQIDLDASREAQLTISSKLLRVAAPAKKA
jgi:hypothetical protein